MQTVPRGPSERAQSQVCRGGGGRGVGPSLRTGVVWRSSLGGVLGIEVCLIIVIMSFISFFLREAGWEGWSCRTLYLVLLRLIRGRMIPL